MNQSWTNRALICQAYNELVAHLSVGFSSTHYQQALEDEQADRLAAFLELIENWTSRVDLVSPAPTELLIERHLIDCIAAGLVLTSAIDPLPQGGFLDVGSGAGLPGVLLAIMHPERKVYLCEPREKRAMFLKEVRRELALDNIEVLHARVQDISEEKTDALALLITRALGLDEVFIEEASRLLAPGGVAINMVGPSWKETDNNHAVQILRFNKLVSYTLGAEGPARKLAVFS